MSDEANQNVEQLRIIYGAWLIAAAFVILAGVLGIAVWRFTKAEEVTGVVGAFTGVIGTVIGAFFGVQAGSAGKDTVQQVASEAQAKAAASQQQLAAVLDVSQKGVLDAARSKHPQAFR